MSALTNLTPLQRVSFGDGASAPIEAVGPLADLYRFGFDQERTLVTVLVFGVLSATLVNKGLRLTIEEVDANALRCARWLDRAADKYPDGPITVARESAAAHRALKAVAALYRLRACRPDDDDDAARAEFLRLRNRANTYCSILAAHRRAAHEGERRHA